MIQVALTITIYSTTSERTFSAMKQINYFLRSIINQDSFSKLSMLSIERHIEINSEKS